MKIFCIPGRIRHRNWIQILCDYERRRIGKRVKGREEGWNNDVGGVREMAQVSWEEKLGDGYKGEDEIDAQNSG